MQCSVFGRAFLCAHDPSCPADRSSVELLGVHSILCFCSWFASCSVAYLICVVSVDVCFFSKYLFSFCAVQLFNARTFFWHALLSGGGVSISCVIF